MGRAPGILVLAAAVIVVSAAALRPDGVDGAAGPIDVPPPPAIGDCVTTSVPAQPDYAPDRSVYDTYPRVSLTPCDGDRYGEVVLVITTPGQPVVVGDTSYMSTDDPNVSACWQAAADYLGMSTPFTDAGIDWTPSLLVEPNTISAPSEFQQAAGQRWVACITAVYGYETPRYHGSLRNAALTGAARDNTGTCFDGTDDSAGFTSGACEGRHTTQLIATAATGRSTARDQVEQSCRTALSEITAMPDITAGGALTVLTIVHDADGDVSAADPVPADGYLGCGLTSTNPTRTLSGGLIGLGDRPLPWTE